MPENVHETMSGLGLNSLNWGLNDQSNNSTISE